MKTGTVEIEGKKFPVPADTDMYLRKILRGETISRKILAWFNTAEDVGDGKRPHPL